MNYNNDEDEVIGFVIAISASILASTTYYFALPQLQKPLTPACVGIALAGAVVAVIGTSFALVGIATESKRKKIKGFTLFAIGLISAVISFII